MRKLNADKLEELLTRRFQADYSAGILCGCVIRICQFHSPLFSKGFGFVSPRGNVPIKLDTVFRMASMTKPMTAALLLKLEEQRLLDLDDPVMKYLPSFSDLRIGCVSSDHRMEDLGPAGEILTIRHLLNHSSGIGSGAVGAWYTEREDPSAARTLEDAVEIIAGEKLAFAPGKAQMYSTAAFDVAARIAELVTERPYADLMRECMLEPCHMEDTTFSPDPSGWARMAGMHDRCNGKSTEGYVNPRCTFEETPVSHPLAGAGIVSTVLDYSNFAEMLLGRGIFRGTAVLRPESVAEMSSPQVTDWIMPGDQRWGLGVRVITGKGYRRLPVGTFGWSGAYGTHFWVDPVNRITAVYLKNSRYDGGSEARTAAQFEEDVHGAFEGKETD